MKVKIFLLALLLPLAASAQQNIMKAWNLFKDHASVTVDGEKHAIEKDPESGEKTYHLEYWTFSVPKDGLYYIKQFAEAFGKDADKAYSYNEGVTSRSEEIQLAVGTADHTASVNVGPKKGSNYRYCLFLDPGDSEARYRYSYSLDWIREGDKYVGTFIITYATTLKYRQAQAQKSGLKTFDVAFVQDSWFTQFMTLASSLDSSHGTTRKYAAGQLFDLTKTAPSQADKDTAIDVLNSLLPVVENRLKDDVTATILKNCIKNLEE